MHCATFDKGGVPDKDSVVAAISPLLVALSLSLQHLSSLLTTCINHIQHVARCTLRQRDPERDEQDGRSLSFVAPITASPCLETV